MRNSLKTAFPFLLLVMALALLVGTHSKTPVQKNQQQCSGKCPSNNNVNGADQLQHNPFKRLIVSL